MPDLDLSAVFRLQPKEIVAWFEAKGYQVTGDWWELWQEAHARKFTVAHLARLDLLKDVAAEVGKIYRDGMTEREFLQELEPRLRKAGWWGKTELEDGRIVRLGSIHRLKTIYRTNKRTAYNAGRYREQVERAKSRPYWQYIAVMDSRTRPDHAALNGKIFRWDDPIWNWLYPPNGWGCRCRVRALSEAYVKRHGLVVSSSEGQLEQVMQQVGVDKSTGEVIERPGVKWTDPVTGDVLLPDPGWSYNPGQKGPGDLSERLRKQAEHLGIDLPKPLLDLLRRRRGPRPADAQALTSQARAAGVAPALLGDTAALRQVLSYSQALGNPDIARMISAGGLHGSAVLAHELAEIRALFDSGLDWADTAVMRQVKADFLRAKEQHRPELAPWHLAGLRAEIDHARTGLALRGIQATEAEVARALYDGMHRTGLEALVYELEAIEVKWPKQINPNRLKELLHALALPHPES